MSEWRKSERLLAGPRRPGGMGSDEPIRAVLVTAEDLERMRTAAARVMGSRPWIQAAYLYGSAAAGKRPSRDIDVAILARVSPSWGAEAAIAADLMEAAPVGLLEYDVRFLGGGSPVFWNNVLADGILMYEADRRARVAFEAYAMAAWLDFRPAWERVRAQVLMRWSDG